eukprot:15433416-Alexandrium_andersonii.AAC.3
MLRDRRGPEPELGPTRLYPVGALRSDSLSSAACPTSYDAPPPRPQAAGNTGEIAPARLSSCRWRHAPSTEYNRRRGGYWKVEVRKKGPGGPRDRIVGARSSPRGAQPLSQEEARLAGRVDGASPGREEKKCLRRGKGDRSAEPSRRARADGSTEPSPRNRSASSMILIDPACSRTTRTCKSARIR